MYQVFNRNFPVKIESLVVFTFYALYSLRLDIFHNDYVLGLKQDLFKGPDKV